MSEGGAGEVLVPEAHDDLDEDMDGRVSLHEFVAAHEEEDDDDRDRVKLAAHKAMSALIS